MPRAGPVCETGTGRAYSAHLDNKQKAQSSD